MSIWFFINVLIFIFVLWKVMDNIVIHTLVGLIGVILILYNWTRHAVFSTIRSKISRKRKIKFAQLSKKLLPIHKWTGTTALVVIIIHASIVLYYFGISSINIKMFTGMLAILALIGVVTFGWLRHMRTTVARRYIHWSLAYTLIFLVILHVIL